MKLEMAKFPVRDVKFGAQTSYRSGTLLINKDELIALVLEDKRVESADMEVAFPGEQTRIVKVRDAVEPRVKVSGASCVFPGIMGPVETAGEGRDHTLPGVTVMASAEYRPTVLSGTFAQNAGLVDMWGLGAQLTPFGSTINAVLKFKLIDGVTELEAHAAIQLAEMKVARRLAETTLELAPEEVETFELAPADPSLPKVIYIMGLLTMWHEPHSSFAYYGLPIRESLPTFVHPNELLDGAVTEDARRGGGLRPTTWALMNSAVVRELLRQHGKQLNFLGVILQRTRYETEFGKHVNAAGTSQMAKLLGADGIIITRISSSGSNYMDVILTVQACEKKGIKTVFLTPEWGGKEGTELPLVYYVPEASAIVSTGSFERDIPLTAPAKVIGVGNTDQVQVFMGDKPFSPHDKVTLPASFLFFGGVDWFGTQNLTRTQY